MKIGMLWFDNSCKPLEAKVALGVQYYEQKYGAKPTACYVHPGTAAAAGMKTPAKIDGVNLVSSQYVMPNHFWIGVE